MKKLITGLGMGLALIPLLVHAMEDQLTLKLTHIERIKSTEERGDELYFSITEYSTKVHPRHYVVPAFPSHWLSDQLEKVNNIELWTRKLQEDEAVTVLVSLIESDAPPWNVDDLIGTVKLKAINHNEQIKTQWQIPNDKYAKKLGGSDNSFSLTGDGGQYHISLSLSTNQNVAQSE